MRYNTLFDSSFEHNQWQFHNCELKDGVFTATSTTFGISQDLILPDPAKLYFRAELSKVSASCTVKIGIQYDDVLKCTEDTLVASSQLVSVVCTPKTEHIRLHIIFESDQANAQVTIKKPMLINLEMIGRTSWLKWLLDRKITFRNGFNYTNEYAASEVTPELIDFTPMQLTKAKTGSICSCSAPMDIDLTANIIPGHYYLIKLDFVEINTLGDMYFKYGVLQSTKIGEQLYLTFKGHEQYQLKFSITPNNIMPYQVNLKHILLVDITTLNLMNEDILYLPFI